MLNLKLHKQKYLLSISLAILLSFFQNITVIQIHNTNQIYKKLKTFFICSCQLSLARLTEST